MKREDVAILAQLLTAMKDSIDKMEEALKNKDAEELAIAKQEILSFQRKIDVLV